MRVLVLVPTTGSVSRVARIEELPEELPASQVILCHGYKPLDGISAYYHALTTGPLAKLLRPAKPRRYQLRLSGPIESGNSWELPVLLAHLVVSLGGELAEEPGQADIVLWATGAVDADLLIPRNDYRLADKVRYSQTELLQAATSGARIIAMVPASEDASRLHSLLTELGAHDPRVVPVNNVRDTRSILEQELSRTQPAAPPEFQVTAAPEPAAPPGGYKTRGLFWKIPALLAAAAAIAAAALAVLNAGNIVRPARTGDEPVPVVVAKKDPPLAARSGPASTLAQIRKTGQVRLGYPNASIPFSYRDLSAQPIGYSIDICKAIVDEIGRTLGRKPEIQFVEVTLENRFRKLNDGTIDLECSSTTNNVDHREQADFSPLIFVSGTKVMVPVSSGLRDISDLKGRTVAVTRGTTNAQALKARNERFRLGITLVESTDHDESYRLLVDGKASAFAADAVLLYGQIARHHVKDRFKVAGEILSYDPYGIAFRRNEPDLHAAVERAVRDLVITRDIDRLYARWFESRLPDAERLDLPMSPQLEEAFEEIRHDSKPPVLTPQK